MILALPKDTPVETVLHVQSLPLATLDAFLNTRRQNATEAAERIINYSSLVREFNLTTDESLERVSKALDKTRNFGRKLPNDLPRNSAEDTRPVLSIRPGGIAETAIEDVRLRIFKMLSAASEHEQGQTIGLVMVVVARGFSVWNLLSSPGKVSQLTSFQRRMIGSAPIKISKILVVEPPAVFASIVLPILKTVFKPKVIGRLAICDPELKMISEELGPAYAEYIAKVRDTGSYP